MLYLHCGWIRTGTTSLQSALIAHRDELADAGLTYPERWRPTGVSDHHGLIDLLSLPDSKAPVAQQRFCEDLHSFPTENVLISSESLTHWVFEEKRDALLNLLAAIGPIMPTTYIWTLRNVADVVKSSYHRFAIAHPGTPPSPAEAMGRLLDNPLWSESLFGGLQRLEKAVGTTRYLKYERSGAHSRQLLQILRLPPELRASIERDLDEKPRLNARLTQKQAAAMLNCEALAAQMGITVTKPELTGLFYRRGFRFAEDRPCNLIDPESATELHERALSAARKCRFRPYLELLEDSEPDLSPAMATDLGLLDEEDLDRLAAEITAFSSTEPLNS